MVPATINRYLLVTKPGIVGGNLIAAAGGFLLASRGQPETFTLVPILAAIALVVASACVFNNCIDRDLDRRMARTRSRVMPLGLIPLRAAVGYGALLGLGGFSLLAASGNGLCVALVAAGFAIYVGAYSLYLKRRSPSATLIGSLAGAAPPLAGYCAARGRFDLGAVLLLCIFCLWQIPHSSVIAIRRRDDYLAAAIPSLPGSQGTAPARNQITGLIAAFTVAAVALSFCGYAGRLYLGTASVVGSCWLLLAWTGYRTADERRWAKRMFVFSIVSIVALSVMMAVDPALPLTPPERGGTFCTSAGGSGPSGVWPARCVKAP